MRGRVAWLLVLLSTVAAAAPRRHPVGFGKWMTVRLAGSAGEPATQMRVRPLFVDGRLREYTLGESHEVTDRLLVVQQADRLNDALAGERGPRWKWQRGGWLLVERASGRVRRLSLPDFNPSASQASWYRDYAAYCGASKEDGRYAVVVQLGRRKPLLRQKMASGCAAPEWQRDPSRVTFAQADGEKRTFEVQGAAADPAPGEQNKAEEQP